MHPLAVTPCGGFTVQPSKRRKEIGRHVGRYSVQALEFVADCHLDCMALQRLLDRMTLRRLFGAFRQFEPRLGYELEGGAPLRFGSVPR